MSILEPKPPEILQKLKWLALYGRKQWKIVLAGFVATVLLSLLSLAIAGLRFDAYGEESEIADVTIRITNQRVEIGAKVEARVVALDVEGKVLHDVPAPEWKSNDASIAVTVPDANESGRALVWGEDVGEATITATIGEWRAETIIEVHGHECVAVSHRIDNYFLRVTVANNCSGEVEFLAYLNQVYGPFSFVSPGVGFVNGETITRVLASGDSTRLDLYWAGDCAGSAVNMIVQPTDRSPVAFEPTTISLDSTFGREGFRCEEQQLEDLNGRAGAMLPTWMLPRPRPRDINDIECVTSGMSILVNFDHRRHISLLGGERAKTCTRCHHHYEDPLRDLMNCWVCHENESDKRSGRTHKGLKVRRIGHDAHYNREFPCVDCHKNNPGPEKYKPDGSPNCRPCHDANEQSHFAGSGDKKVPDNYGGTHHFSHLRHSNAVRHGVQMRCTACHHRFLEGTRCDTRAKCSVCHAEGSWNMLVKLGSWDVVSMDESLMCLECHDEGHRQRFGRCNGCHSRRTRDSLWARLR